MCTTAVASAVECSLEVRSGDPSCTHPHLLRLLLVLCCTWTCSNSPSFPWSSLLQGRPCQLQGQNEPDDSKHTHKEVHIRAHIGLLVADESFPAQVLQYISTWCILLKTLRARPHPQPHPPPHPNPNTHTCADLCRRVNCFLVPRSWRPCMARTLGWMLMPGL